jgi:hypothetical protein
MVQRKEGKKISDDAEWMNEKDILKCTRELFTKNNYKFVIHTDDGEFVYCESKDAIFKLLSQSEGMIMTDKGTLGNMNRMKSVDYEVGKVFFDEEKENYVTISASKENAVKTFIKKLFGK